MPAPTMPRLPWTGFPPAPSWSQIALFVGYAVAFLLAHRSAGVWGGSYFFSLFYPAAGIRFALLWHMGPRQLTMIVAAEVAVQILTGVIPLGSPEAIDQLVGVVRAPIAYGIAITLVRWIVKKGGPDIATPPMPFGLASVTAPILASLSYFAWIEINPASVASPSDEPLITTTIAFMIGDLLGVLLMAPGLLVLAGLWSGHRPALAISLLRSAEAVIFFALGGTFALAARQVSPGLMMTPVMLTTAWIGLRCGRVAAWLAIVVVALFALPISHQATDIPTRLAIHMGLAGVAIAGYIAGSYGEAQRRAQFDIARRDRLLYQAERLKTLRAMSVAVIHEISQPLSTLSIESRHLAKLVDSPASNREEIRDIAALLQRKVDGLAEMVRRLRRFGGRAVDEPSAIAISSLLHDALAIVRTEARAARVDIAVGEVSADLVVVGQDIELVQALVNLVRNAIAANPGGTINIGAGRDADIAFVEVANGITSGVPSSGGMGVGSLVARAIVEAHGGRIVRSELPGGRMAHRFCLPLQELSNV